MNARKFFASSVAAVVVAGAAGLAYSQATPTTPNTQQSGTTANPIQLNNNAATRPMNNNSTGSMNNTPAAPSTSMNTATTERPMQADRN